MPLIRYDIRNECSLASRELLSATPKNDPSAALEGVAMVGLVGLVRQLGNLAEFAADLFHDLHDEIMTTAARSHDLVLKVQQLETKLPYFEKAFFSENNRLRFAYKTGAEWHARIRVRQSHFSEGDLPEFIRNSYHKCRRPPKFFLLDKFDIAGAGACSKRYSDPSFFKTRWANSELKKAEKIREDRKARRMKRRGYYCGNRKVNVYTYEPLPTPRRVRYSSLSSDTWDSYSDISTPQSIGGIQSKMSLKSFSQEGKSVTSKKTYGLNEQKVLPSLKLRTLRELLEAEESFESLNLSAKESETETLFGRFRRVNMNTDLERQVEEAVEVETVDMDSEGQQIIEDNASEEDQIVEDIASETDHNASEEDQLVEDIASKADQTDEYNASEEDQLVEDNASEADQTDEDNASEVDQLVEDIASEADQTDEETASEEDQLVEDIASEADQIHEVIATEEEQIVEDIASEQDQFLDAMSSMDSESDTESRATTESIHDLMKGNREPENVSAVRYSSENEGLEGEQDDLSVHEIDHISEHQLGGVNLSVLTEKSCSSPSHTSGYSTDEDENALIGNQAHNQFWLPTEKFAKNVAGMRVQDKNVPLLSQKYAVGLALKQANNPPTWQPSDDNSSSPADTATQVSQESPVHCLLPESITLSREQSSETSHEQDFLERERYNSLTSKSAPHETITTGASFLSKESEDAKIRCIEQKSPGSPPFTVRKSSQLHVDNHCLARRSLRFIDDTVNPKPPRMSDSSHSSSSMPGSSPSNGDANHPSSPSASSVSSFSSPKSPIFSALHSPMSPVTSSYISVSSKSGRKVSSEMMRSCFLSPVPKLLSSPSLKGKPPPPPPLPPVKWNSKLTLNTPSGLFNKPLQAPLTPPPPPPPPPLRMHSKLVQPVPRVQLGSRSVLLGPRHDDLIKSISVYDRSKLKKVTIERFPKTKVMDERDVLLEQIKNKSFSLRRIAVEKRQKTDSINVAAILEKANAIRQAFAGSDEEDTLEEWTEAQT